MLEKKEISKGDADLVYTPPGTGKQEIQGYMSKCVFCIYSWNYKRFFSIKGKPRNTFF